MRAFRLERWKVFPDRNTISDGSRERRLAAREMDLPVCLAAESGAVVSKERLLGQVWQHRAVEDHVLPKTMSDLRRALGDNARKPTFIQTVPKRGYRLLREPEPLLVGRSTPAPGAASRRAIFPAAAAACLAAVALSLPLMRSSIHANCEPKGPELVKLPVKIHLRINDIVDREVRVEDAMALDFDWVCRDSANPRRN